MTDPYYDEDGITIYHGDALELLPSLVADSVITDPPYGTGHYATDTACFTGDVLRQLADIGPCAVFGYPERMVATCVAAGMTPDEWVTWWPTNAAIKAFSTVNLLCESEVVAVFGPNHLGDLRQVKPAASRRILDAGYEQENPTRLLGGQRLDQRDTRRMGDVWTDASPNLGFLSHRRQHPNEKPLGVMLRLVEGVGVGTILDPFCGSGTTLRAAKDYGHKAIGVEVVEAHCETAAKRLAQGSLDFTGSDGA